MGDLEQLTNHKVLCEDAVERHVTFRGTYDNPNRGYVRVYRNGHLVTITGTVRDDVFYADPESKNGGLIQHV